MNTVLVSGMSNAVLAAVLFIFIRLSKSRIQNPAILHLLWGMVLLKLITPPVWTPELVLLPATTPAAVATKHQYQGAASALTDDWESKVSISESQVYDVSLAPMRKTGNHTPTGESLTSITWILSLLSRLDPSHWLLLAWASGTLSLWSLSIWRMNQMRSCLRFATKAPEEIQQRVKSLSRQWNLRRCPEVWYVPGQVSPMLWAFFCPARIIVPATLFDKLDSSAQDTMLLHELAHYRRGDHLVRWLELISLGLYWWNPVAWMVSRELRTAEELACDALVISERPLDRRVYAELLVTTLGFLSRTRLPSLATGISRQGKIETRLINIMSGETNTSLTRRMKLLLAGIAMLLLPLAPALVRAQQNDKKGKVEPIAVAKQNEVSTNDQFHPDSGIVVDPNGKPVPDVEIQGFYQGQQRTGTIKTDNKGQFHVPADWYESDDDRSAPLLLARKGGDKLGWLHLQILRMMPDALDQTGLKPTARIVLSPLNQKTLGTVVDPTGKPMPDIQIRPRYMGANTNPGIAHFDADIATFFTCKTDRKGAFTIHLPAGTSGALEPVHDDWQQLAVAFDPNVRDVGEIKLQPAGRIEGTVTDGATGKPAANQKVFAQALDASQNQLGFMTHFAALTNDEGKYVMGGMAPGKFNILFVGDQSKKGKQSRLTANAVEGVKVVAGKSVQADFRIIEGRRLSGKVLDQATGRPIAKISVGYYGQARPNSSAACLMVQTNGAGEFEFYVPPGMSKIYVASGNRMPTADSSRTFEVPTDRDLEDVNLKAGGEQQLTYRSDAIPFPSKKKGKTPAAEEDDDSQIAKKFSENLVTLQVSAQPPQGMQTKQIIGKLVFKGHQQSSMWADLSLSRRRIPLSSSNVGKAAYLIIEAEAFAPVRSDEFIIQAQMPEIRVPLEKAIPHPVRGRVVDHQGQPVEGAQVRVARVVLVEEEEFPFGLEYLTDAAGRFEIKHSRIGDAIQIRVEKDGAGRAQSEWMTLDATSEQDLDELVIKPVK